LSEEIIAVAILFTCTGKFPAAMACRSSSTRAPFTGAD
jgi:hypothetical protein